MKKIAYRPQIRDFEYYSSIFDSGFFKIAAPNAGGIIDESGNVSSANELTLLGTITGPPNFSRALIQKRGEQNPKVFALYRISSEISNDVFGYKLIKILNTKVYLKTNGDQIILDMFQKGGTENPQGSVTTASGSKIVTKTISKSELQQKMSKNMDNALQGIAARPNRIDGIVNGFTMVRIPPYNILYQLGIRSGDVIKRINNHPIDSTQKLLQLWESLMNESRIKVDIERQNQIITLDFNISD